MDRTNEFHSIIEETSADIVTKAVTTASPILLQSSDLLIKISKFENLVEGIYEQYIDYHRYYPSETQRSKKNLKLSEEDRKILDDQMLRFITSIAVNIQGLDRIIEKMFPNQTSVSFQFYKSVISFLLNKLHNFSKLTERMQNEFKQRSQSPYRLLSHLYEDEVDIINKPILKHNELSTTNISTSSSNQISLSEKKNFAQRYVDEIASISKMKEYNNIAEKHKDSLLKEAKILHVKFSEDILQSQQMERTVYGISNMIGEFSNLIESQSEQVENIGEISKDATKSVQQTDEELLLTLQRSSSHQQMMTFLIIGLSVMLLILDYLTP